MLKELNNLKQYATGVKRASDDRDAAARAYGKQIRLITQMLDAVKTKMKADPAVQQAAKDLEEMMSAYDGAEALAKQAVVNYWEEFGFSTGKKSVTVEGCKLSIRETISRQVVDPDVMVVVARKDGVYSKVIKALKPVLNRASFNAWVDLKSPLGVEVTYSTTATVVVLEEDK